MNDLAATYEQLRQALAPLGVELGREVLALWQDRERHNSEPLPADALRHLADLTTRLIAREPP